MPSASCSSALASLSAWGRAQLRSLLGGWRMMALVAVLGGAAGCGHMGGIGVKPHQRELLSDRTMRLDGNAQERAADEHVLSNREGAVGGTGTAGGGCGCN